MECMQDGVPLFCDLLSERRVGMFLHHDISIADFTSLASFGSNVTLKGISQPAYFDSYR